MTGLATIEHEEVSEPRSMAVSLQSAEIDQQISTARNYPRSLKDVQNKILSMATLDEESAKECLYALPRGGKPIKGPSIRFAEVLKQSFGNCRSAARVIDVDRIEMFVEAEGVFHDLESNSASTARVRRRISDKNGKLFNNDMIIVTGNAACSIAMRNAILAGVPKPIWRNAWQQVEATAVGKNKSLAQCIDEAKKGFGAKGVTIDEICSSLGVPSEKDITTDHIIILAGMFSALESGEATVDEMFRSQGGTKKSSDMAERYKPKSPDTQVGRNNVERATESKNTGAETANSQASEQEDGDAPQTSPSSDLNLEMLKTVRDELFLLLEHDDYLAAEEPGKWAKGRAGVTMGKLQGSVLSAASPKTHDAAKQIVETFNAVVDGTMSTDKANAWFTEMWGS